MVSWIAIVVVLVFIGAVVGVVTLARRRDRQNLPLVRFVGGLATVAAMIVGLLTVVGVALTLAGQSVTVGVPVDPRMPTLPHGITDVTGPTATIVGGASHFELSLAGLSIGTRILLALGQLFGGATFVLIAWLVRRLAWSAITADACRGAASRAIGASAVVLAVGSLAASVLSQIGGYRAGVEALQLTSWGANGAAAKLLDGRSDLSVFGWPAPSFALTFEFTPLLIALALGCIATIFREGERLRVRAERAEADIAGLV